MTRTSWTVLAALLALGASGTAAQDQDRDRTMTRDPGTHTSAESEPLQTRDHDRIRDVLRTDGKVPANELAALDPEITRYLQQKGKPDPLGETVRTAAREGCTGACAGDVVRETNRVMAQGYGDQDAAVMVKNAVREQYRAGTGAGAATQGTGAGAGDRDRLRARVDEQLRERDRERDRDGQGQGQGPEREHGGGPPAPSGGGGTHGGGR